MKASAVVLSYARVGNLPAIVEGLLLHPFVDDVVVWHQGPQPLRRHDLPGAPRVAVVPSKNNYTYGRFLATAVCQHDTILTCDDDNLQLDWPAIFDDFCESPEAITASLKAPGHYNADKNNHWGTAHEVLLGWGACFDRRWVVPTFKRYTEEYGYDEVLYRKADRLFSILLARTHNVLSAKVQELPGATDPRTALYLRSDHYRLTRQARRRALDLLGIMPQKRI